MTSTVSSPPAVPAVSVIIPTYNQAHFLDGSIDSVLRQTVPAAEIIVVDDGSEDEPARFAKNFPGVRLIRQRNRGLASARNTGWKAARGEFLVFLDADDRLNSRALELNLAQYEANPECGFVYGAHRKIDIQGKEIYRDNLKTLGDDPYATLLTRNPVAMHGTVMYRRELLESVGGFDPRLRACEDYDLYLRLARDRPVTAVPKILADYRIHGSNMSGDYPLMLRSALTVLRRQAKFARTRPDWHAAYRTGLQRWKTYYAGEQAAKLASGRPVSVKLARETLAMLWLAPRPMAAAIWRTRGMKVEAA